MTAPFLSLAQRATLNERHPSLTGVMEMGERATIEGP
jgi:hypothetical protein